MAMEVLFLKLVCLDTNSKPENLPVSLKNLNVERSILQIDCDKPAKVSMAWGDIWGDTEKGYTQEKMKVSGCAHANISLKGNVPLA